MHRRGRVLLVVGIMALSSGLAVAAVQGPVAAGASSPVAPGALHGWSDLPGSQSGLLPIEPAHVVPSTGSHISGRNAPAETTNWSGYVATGGQFTGVSGTWVVPAVQPAESTEASASWIGIDGYTNDSLIQTGTEQITSGGTTAYNAWYELIPAGPVSVGNVEPGDEMQDAISEVSPGVWSISIEDLTSQQSASGDVSYSTPGASAEWIEEAPSTNSGQVVPLANFGTVQFSNIGMSNADPDEVTQNAVEMVDSDNNVIASPGPLADSAFTVTDNSSAPTPATTTTTASVNPSATTSGSSVTYSTTVTSDAGSPTGTVTFAVGSTVLCTTAALVNGSGSCTATNAPVGTDTVTANYSGNSTYAPSSGSVTLVVAAESPPATTHGYWLVGSDGGIFTFGAARFYGSTGNLALQRPVVGMTLTAERQGYWLVASDGGVFTFGDAGFYGSIPGLGIAPAGSPGTGRKLNAPIVGMVPSADGGGYFMVAADGGVFAFGDAKFEGSCPGIGGCSGAAVAVMPDASGNGYWVVTATGHVYTFGDAAYFGAPGPQSTPVTSAVRTPDGKGYWILLANGTVDPFGDATNLGDPLNETGGLDPATAIFATADGGGYWVSSATGAVFAYGDAPNHGGMAGTHLNGSIIAGVGF